MNGQLRIDEMYAFIVLDKDGTEGIPAFNSGPMMLPMVGADMERIDSMREIAESMATDLGVSITLVKFTNREQLEVISPSA